MIDIDRIEGQRITVEYSPLGDSSLTFQFSDLGGTVRNATISAFALRTLSEALSVGQGAILERFMPQDKAISVAFSLGDTREEIYGVEVTQ